MGVARARCAAKMAAAETTGRHSLNRAGDESRDAAEPEKETDGGKKAYPLLPMALLMTVTVGQRCQS